MDPVGEIVGQYQALWLFATILAAQRPEQTAEASI